MISDLSQRVEIRRIQVNENFGFEGIDSEIPPIQEVSILTTNAHIKEIKRSSAVQQQLAVENINYKMIIRYATGREVRKDDIVIWLGKRYKALTSSSMTEIDKRKFLETLIVIQDG